MLQLLLAVGGSLLVVRLIRTANKVGLFAAEAARCTRELGWFLVVMSLVWPIGGRAGIGFVVAGAIPQQHWWSQITYGIPISFAVLLTGLGVLSFARILRLAVPLQTEADLTV